MTASTPLPSSAQAAFWITLPRLTPFRISQLRNDIAHHQPIIDIPVAERHQDMLDLAAAIDPAAAAWIGALSRVDEMLAARPAAELASP